MGDFNLPNVRWNNTEPVQNISPTESLFFNLFCTLGFTQLVLEPTFIPSGNILDLVLTTDEDRVINLDTLPPYPHCGHALIKFSLLMQGPPSNLVSAPSPRQLNWVKGKYRRIRHDLSFHDWEHEFSNLDIDQMTNHLTTTLINLANSHIPIKKNSPPCPPWHKNVPRATRNLRSRAWQEYKDARRRFGRRSPQALHKLNQVNTINAELRSSTLVAQSNYEEHLAAQRKDKPKLFHSYIRHKKKARPRVGPLSIHGNLSDDPSAMADQFVNAFSSVFSVEEVLDPSPHQYSQGSIEEINLDIQDVRNRLKQLKSDSAMGPDNLHPLLLKECADELALPFYLLFSKSLHIGKLPHTWKTSLVTPIFKKGKRTDPLNYRPISLTPIPCKILERIISKTLYSFIEEYLIFDDAQYGFRPNRSVVDQLLLTYNDITYWYDQGATVDLILFDFTKAFDRVQHNILLDKLVCLGISGPLLEWIRSFLIGRTMKVSIHGSHSLSKLVASGVPQGSVLGPLLFILFVNYIGARLTCKYMLFADDLKLYLRCPSKSSGMSSPELQQNINILYETAASWGLQFAQTKCVHLRFTRRQTDKIINSIYHLNNTPIKPLPFHRDLGVIVETQLKFHQHIKDTANKAGGVATSILKSTVCRSPNFMTTILMSDIRPILDFASPIWNLGFVCDYKLLETVQRRWTKNILGLTAEVSYDERLRRLNLFSMKGRLLRSDMILCYKIFHGLSSITPSDLFHPPPRPITRGHRYKIHPQHINTDIRKRFFSHRVIKHWNSLPPEVAEAESLQRFKNKLPLALGNELYSYHD